MYYLAYGMNTNLGGMLIRCPRAVSLGKVLLEDHILRFCYHADAKYSPGEIMECALWDITDECERSLDALEGYPHYYEKKMVTVTWRGEEIEAMIYYMRDVDAEGPPAQSYYNSVLQGYYQHEMDLTKLHQAYYNTLNLDLIDLKENL